MRLLAVTASAVGVGMLVLGFLGLKLPLGRRVRRRSSRRGSTIAPGEGVSPNRFRAIRIGVGVLVFAFVTLLTAVPAVAVVPAIATSWAVTAWHGRRQVRRQRELLSAWPDGLRDLRAMVTSGLSLHRALSTLAEHGPQPLQAAFARHDVRARAIGVVGALRLVQEELADPTSDAVIEVLVLAQERGGAVLPELLDELAKSTTQDVETAEALATESLEQRINAKAVFVLPWLVLLALTLQAGVFRDFYATTAGTMVVLVGAVMSLAGMAIVTRLARRPEQPRVFGAGAEASS